MTFAFTFHMHWLSIKRSLYIRIFWASFLIKFLSPDIATSINTHIPFSLSWIMMYVLLLGIVLLVCTGWFHKMVASLSRHVLTYFGTCSYQCSLSNFTSISLHMLKCSWAHILSCLFMCCSFANIGHADIMCSTVSSNCLESAFAVSVFNIFVAWYLACNA